MIPHWVQTYTSCHIPGWALGWALGSNNGTMPEPSPKALRGHTQGQDRVTSAIVREAGAGGTPGPSHLGEITVDLRLQG